MGWLLAIAALLVVAPCSMADARTAKIVLVVNGDERMQADLKELIERFEKDQPLSGDSLGLLQGAQAAAARINTALRSRGFYDATVTATVEGRPIAEAAALDAIDARPENDAVSFSFDVATGPRYQIGEVAIRPPGTQTSLPAIEPGKIGMVLGEPADAATILAGQDKLLEELRKQGYALATIKREVVVDHATRKAEVTFTVESGPIARMGPVHFSGTDKVDTVWLQRRVPFTEGELYDPAKVEALRGKLTSLGTFNAVRIKPATALDAKGELPIDVELTDRPPRSIGSVSATRRSSACQSAGFWTHRNLSGQAEPAPAGRTQSHRRGRQGQRHRLCLPRRLSQARLVDGRPGCPTGGGGIARGVPRLYAQGGDRLCRFRSYLLSAMADQDGATGEISNISRNGITMDYQLVGLPCRSCTTAPTTTSTRPPAIASISMSRRGSTVATSSPSFA